jgi:hypothetical protein
VSLVGEGTGVAATGLRDEEQGRDPPDSGLGTGLGAQPGTEATRVGTGTGVAEPAPVGRGLATGLGDVRLVGESDGTGDGAAAFAEAVG